MIRNTKYLDSYCGGFRVWLESDGSPRMSPPEGNYPVRSQRLQAYRAIRERRDYHQQWIDAADRWLDAAAREGWDQEHG